jgi:chromosome segregation ATPase
MMFLTQMSGTVLQSLRLSDTGGIIMEAAIIAGLFNIGGILLTYLLTKKDTLKKLDKKMDVYHAELKNSVNVKNNTLSAEHAGLSKEHTGLKEQINNEHAGLKEQINNEHTALEKQFSVAQAKLDHLHDESIRMEGFRKDVEKQGVDVTAIKVGIDALAQKNGENITQVRDLTRDLEKSEQKLERSEEELVDVRKELQYYKEELAQSQRENQQLKQQIYNLQHPQQSWDEPER